MKLKLGICGGTLENPIPDYIEGMGDFCFAVASNPTSLYTGDSGRPTFCSTIGSKEWNHREKNTLELSVESITGYWYIGAFTSRRNTYLGSRHGAYVYNLYATY